MISSRIFPTTRGGWQSWRRRLCAAALVAINSPDIRQEPTYMNSTYDQIQEIGAAVREQADHFERLLSEVQRVIVGQDDLLRKMVVGLLTGGHLLLEGVPGLAKTTAVATLASAIGTRFQRLQFTPDLLPADIIGTQIYQPRDGSFIVKQGPVFANLILADEINRAPAKVQSALLEAMQERQVTIGEATFPLPRPFLVLATQNPIEQEGTYPLPEAQVDRFLLKLQVRYPSAAEERQILDRMGSTQPPPTISPVLTVAQIDRARELLDQIYMDDKVRDYIVDLVQATRRPRDFRLDIDNLIEYGASPRATLALALGARALAFLAGRGYVTPQDVKSIAPDALRHRVIISYEAEAEEKSADEIVRHILDFLPVP
jgi:MoxR-like ATPase